MPGAGNEMGETEAGMNGMRRVIWLSGFAVACGSAGGYSAPAPAPVASGGPAAGANGPSLKLCMDLNKLAGTAAVDLGTLPATPPAANEAKRMAEGPLEYVTRVGPIASHTGAFYAPFYHCEQGEQSCTGGVMQLTEGGTKRGKKVSAPGIGEAYESVDFTATVVVDSDGDGKPELWVGYEPQVFFSPDDIRPVAHIAVFSLPDLTMELHEELAADEQTVGDCKTSVHLADVTCDGRKDVVVHRCGLTRCQKVTAETEDKSCVAHREQSWVAFGWTVNGHLSRLNVP